MTINESLGIEGDPSDDILVSTDKLLDNIVDNILNEEGHELKGPLKAYKVKPDICTLYGELNKELFHITAKGRVIKNGEDVTGDNEKMAQCFIDFMAIAHDVKIDA